MSEDFLTSPFDHLVKTTPAVEERVRKNYAKVRKYLRLFARGQAREVGALTLMDVCDESGNLLPEVVAAIRDRPIKLGSTPETHAAYSGQIISRLSGVITALISVLAAPSAKGEPTDLSTAVPEFLKPVLAHLPRLSSTRATAEQRAKLPLSKRGHYALKVFLNVTARHHVTSLDDLFRNHWADVRREGGAVCLPSEVLTSYTLLAKLRRKCGYVEHLHLPPLRMDDLPPLLREQIENYVAKAPTGAAADSALRRLAREKGVELSVQERSTIDRRRRLLLSMLTRVPMGDGMGITDLIRVESRLVDEDGDLVTRYSNPIVDELRRQERERRTSSKEIGFDSASFAGLCGAIMSVAAYNGVFRYHRRFAEVYKPELDKATRTKKKAAKKKEFPITWVDHNLSLLKPRFAAICKQGSFKTDPRSLRLVLCYVVVMMLRYTGVRQQGVCICRVGWNVMFNKDGSITFHWRKDEIKNDKDFTKTIKPTHADTFAPLVEAIRLYYRRVYPYLLSESRRAGVDLNEQLFVEVSTGGTLRSFNPNPIAAERLSIGAERFSKFFKRLTCEFFDFSDVAPEMRTLFHAHHIRGIAGDWIYYDLGVTIEGTARFLGNNRRTVEGDYLDKNKIDSTLVMDEADERAAAIRNRAEKAAGLSVESQLAAMTRQLASRDGETAELVRQLRKDEERLERAESRNAALEAQLAIKDDRLARSDDEIKLLREQLAELQSSKKRGRVA